MVITPKTNPVANDLKLKERLDNILKWWKGPYRRPLAKKYDVELEKCLDVRLRSK